MPRTADAMSSRVHQRCEHSRELHLLKNSLQPLTASSQAAIDSFQSGSGQTVSSQKCPDCPPAITNGHNRSDQVSRMSTRSGYSQVSPLSLHESGIRRRGRGCPPRITLSPARYRSYRSHRLFLAPCREGESGPGPDSSQASLLPAHELVSRAGLAQTAQEGQREPQKRRLQACSTRSCTPR